MTRCHLIQSKPIAVLTGCLDSFMELGQHTIYRNKVEYCKRHGYHLELLASIRPEYKDPKSHAGGFSWSRLAHLLDMVESGVHEWIWTVGGDTLVTNMGIKLESIIATACTPQAESTPMPKCPEFKGYGVPEGLGIWPRNGSVTGKKHLIVAGECVGSLQADSFIMRCSPESAAYLKDILSCHWAYKHHVWAEQRAMMDRIEKHAAITHIVPQHVLNSCDGQVWQHLGRRYISGVDAYGYRGYWKPGDLIVHWGGLVMAKRLELLKKYEPLIKR